ncbi:MAG: trypsin-like peptidase domain-containing protein [Deltaproteobacteria bacterium]|nr:trypsin-like peptidase domain-containing protein [Deltaproteobacteria bacterium]
MNRRKVLPWLVCFASCALVFAAHAEDKKLTEGIAKQLLDTVVSIEVLKAGGKGKPIGTGFLVRHPTGLTVLVTAKHVILKQNSTSLIDNLAYRLNIKGKPSHLFPADFAPHLGSKWFRSEEHDVAVKFIAFFKDITELKTIPYDFFLPKERIRPGANILVAGFPLGQRSEEHASPIVRRGIVALVEKSRMLVDAFTFPGNSGSPVFYVPTLKFSGDLLKFPSINRDRLVGLVSSQISYVEIAISAKTGRPRVTFEDNAGLTQIVACDAITALLDRDDVKAKVRELSPSYKGNTGRPTDSSDKK